MQMVCCPKFSVSSFKSLSPFYLIPLPSWRAHNVLSSHGHHLFLHLLNGNMRVDVCLRCFPIPATMTPKETSHGKVDLGLGNTDKDCPWHRSSCSKVKLVCLNPRARSGHLSVNKVLLKHSCAHPLLWPITKFMLEEQLSSFGQNCVETKPGLFTVLSFRKSLSSPILDCPWRTSTRYQKTLYYNSLFFKKKKKA